MRDEAPALYRKEKAFRSSVVPSLVTFRSLKRIERAIDFDRIDLPRRIFQFSLLWPSLRIEGPPTPRRISPSGYTYSNVRILPHVNYSVGSARIRARMVRRRIHVANPCRTVAVIGELLFSRVEGYQQIAHLHPRTLTPDVGGENDFYVSPICASRAAEELRVSISHQARLPALAARRWDRCAHRRGRKRSGSMERKRIPISEGGSCARNRSPRYSFQRILVRVQIRA